jgi:hypothetical protein
MLRPEIFQQAQVAMQNVPYVLGDDYAKNPFSGGVLGRGQIVWTQESEPSHTRVQATIGFLDGVGLVSLNPQSLIRADVLNSRRSKA